MLPTQQSFECGRQTIEFVNGVRSGQGHFIPPQSHWNRKNMKEEYKGHWANDCMHGEGVYSVEQPEGWGPVVPIKCVYVA